jgi:O-antigen/teichoic acid export membrane protein
MLQRVFKNIAALGVGQIIHILSQLALPPVFIAAYGVDGFALWLLLTAATSHLCTLDFGLQTYLVNELTLLHHRGERARFHQIQSVGVRLALALVAIGLAATAAVIVLPMGNWLGFSYTPDTRLTLCFLSLQILGAILFGQFNGLYRVIGQAQRGVNWQNLQRALTLVGTLALAAGRAPFWAIAATQAACIIVVLVTVLMHLRRTSPEIFPRSDYWSANDARQILGQSAFFGLFSLNQLLVFQIPVLLLNRFVSPSAVVAYSVGRTLFSFVRQLANLLMAALAPELTRLMGSKDKATLGRTYRSVESIICATAFVGCIGVFLISPWCLKYWLRKPELFDAALFLLLMLSSLAMLVKESKLYFQHATNEHIPTAVITSAAYGAMLGCAIPAIRLWGATGLLVTWLLSEMVQILFLHRYNARLIGDGHGFSAVALVKLGAATACAAILLWGSGNFLREGDTAIQILKGIAVLSMSAVTAFLLFDLAPLARQSWIRFRRMRSNHPLTPAIHTL